VVKADGYFWLSETAFILSLVSHSKEVAALILAAAGRA
jgi:hypothetical protein